MKLLYITNAINGSGGLERVLSIKTTFFAEKFKHDVEIMVLNDLHLNPFYTFSNKIKFHSIVLKNNPMQFFFDYVLGIRKVVKKSNPDIILVCDDGFKGFLVPKILRTKKPIIYERHASIILNTNQSLKGKLQKWLMQKLASSFDKFIVLTSTNTEEWLSKNIEVIPNPLTFYPEKSSSLQNKRAIVVGSQSYVKGYDLLIDVWGKVQKKYPDWELHCFGKFDNEAKFEKLRKQKQVNTIFFHEPQKQIQNEYLKSSFLILSSRSEGFGMVIIEAMACGIPAIAFDCPSGPKDIIKNNEDGFLIEANNVDLMVEKISQMIEDDNLRIKMGICSKENVKRYLPENLLNTWNDLFYELVK